MGELLGITRRRRVYRYGLDTFDGAKLRFSNPGLGIFKTSNRGVEPIDSEVDILREFGDGDLLRGIAGMLTLGGQSGEQLFENDHGGGGLACRRFPVSFESPDERIMIESSLMNGRSCSILTVWRKGE